MRFGDVQDFGHEYGATTGRPRRCGWLDVFILHFTHSINGYSSICLTKLDVLSVFDTLKIGVAYRHRGKRLQCYPGSLNIMKEVRNKNGRKRHTYRTEDKNEAHQRDGILHAPQTYGVSPLDLVHGL